LNQQSNHPGQLPFKSENLKETTKIQRASSTFEQFFLFDLILAEFQLKYITKLFLEKVAQIIAFWSW